MSNSFPKVQHFGTSVFQAGSYQHSARDDLTISDNPAETIIAGREL
jgi:hypothetical protein